MGTTGPTNCYPCAQIKTSPMSPLAQAASLFVNMLGIHHVSDEIAVGIFHRKVDIDA